MSLATFLCGRPAPRPNPPEGEAVRLVSRRARDPMDDEEEVEARVGAKVLGRATWRVIPVSRYGGPRRVSLEMLYLAPEARRGALALRLLERVRQLATQRGAEQIEMVVVWQGALLLVERVFGTARRRFLGDAVREYTWAEAMAYLPAVSPERDGVIDAREHLDVVYRLGPRR